MRTLPLGHPDYTTARDFDDELDMSAFMNEMFHRSSDEEEDPPQEEREKLMAVQQEGQQPISKVCFQFASIIIQLPLHSMTDPLHSSLAFKVWRSSLVAAARLAQLPTLALGSGAEASYTAALSGDRLQCRGKKVLEIGCGQALAGLLAGQLGASSVTLTDIKDEALVALRVHVMSSPYAGNDGCGGQGVSTSNVTSSLALPPPACIYRINHLLWQQDRLALDLLLSPVEAGDADTAHDVREERRRTEAARCQSCSTGPLPAGMRRLLSLALVNLSMSSSQPTASTFRTKRKASWRRSSSG